MKDIIRNEILFDLDEAVKILSNREPQDYQQLEELSNHAIEDVAAHKDLDLVTVTVLLYSLFKVIQTLSNSDYDYILNNLEGARDSLKANDLGKYNSYIRKCYEQVRNCNAKVKHYLEDVMQAARIKKGALLLEKGLSIGQAAGLMGLTNWDLQTYAGRTTAIGLHREIFPAKKRMALAMKIFGV
ncbi:hypothetical protein J4437_05910 [Candidatus Woesearchaeota archaeon]|nr:hypothetical protein [Candidatus Woesearchaeota archaeon]